MITLFQPVNVRMVSFSAKSMQMETKMSVIEATDKKKIKRYSDLVRVPALIKENEVIKYIVWEELGSVME